MIVSTFTGYITVTTKVDCCLAILSKVSGRY